MRRTLYYLRKLLWSISGRISMGRSTKLFECQSSLTKRTGSGTVYILAKNWKSLPKCKCLESKVDLAWAVWMVTNMSFGGSPSGGWKWDNGTAGSHSGIVTEHYRQSFSAAIHERLKEVQISCRDALTVIRQRDREETFFFLDPPYPETEQKHYHGFSVKDLEDLLAMLSNIKGKFLLCNYDSALLRKYARKSNWNTTAKDLPIHVSNFRGHSRRKQEVMVYNYTIEPQLFDM